MGAILGGGLVQTEEMRQALADALDRLYGQHNSLGDSQIVAEPSASGVAGGTKKSSTNRRSKEGKVRFHGADRVLRYYKPTEAELDLLGELNADTNRAYGGAAFCFGVFFNVLIAVAFSAGVAASTRAGAIVLGACALVAAIWYYREAKSKHAKWGSALDRIKADHDFTNI